jgi:hypothetical protein
MLAGFLVCTPSKHISPLEEASSRMSRPSTAKGADMRTCSLSADLKPVYLDPGVIPSSLSL